MRKYLTPIVVALFLTGCSTSREAKKDAQALVRIALSQKLSNEAHKIWLANNPTPYKPPVIIKGKDSIVYIYDTVFANPVGDSLIKIACPTLNMDSLRKALTRTNIEKHYIHDTLREIDSTYAALYYQKVAENEYLSGQSNVKDRQLAENAAELKSVKLQRTLGGIVAALIIGFLVYIVIRKK